MKLTPRNWSPETIRSFAAEGGGLPSCPMYFIAENGDCVGWFPDGEVRTIIPAERVIIAEHRGFIPAGGSVEFELVWIKAIP